MIYLPDEVSISIQCRLFLRLASLALCVTFRYLRFGLLEYSSCFPLRQAGRHCDCFFADGILSHFVSWAGCFCSYFFALPKSWLEGSLLSCSMQLIWLHLGGVYKDLGGGLQAAVYFRFPYSDENLREQTSFLSFVFLLFTGMRGVYGVWVV